MTTIAPSKMLESWLAGPTPSPAATKAAPNAADGAGNLPNVPAPLSLPPLEPAQAPKLPDGSVVRADGKVAIPLEPRALGVIVILSDWLPVKFARRVAGDWRVVEINGDVWALFRKEGAAGVASRHLAA